jgi:micrococcal nuclease
MKYIVFVIALVSFVLFWTVSPQVQKELNTSEVSYGSTENLTLSEEIMSQKVGPYEVLYVIDGDTLSLSIDNADTRVRLIGLDSPEVDGPYTQQECFSEEASVYMTQLVDGQSVYLEYDPSQDRIDAYGRLLVFVFLEDGTNVAAEMIKKGYAREYTYRGVPYMYQEQFQKNEALARASEQGLWGQCF